MRSADARQPRLLWNATLRKYNHDYHIAHGALCMVSLLFATIHSALTLLISEAAYLSPLGKVCNKNPSVSLPISILNCFEDDYAFLVKNLR